LHLSEVVTPPSNFSTCTSDAVHVPWWATAGGSRVKEAAEDGAGRLTHVPSQIPGGAICVCWTPAPVPGHGAVFAVMEDGR